MHVSLNIIEQNQNITLLIQFGEMFKFNGKNIEF